MSRIIFAEHLTTGIELFAFLPLASTCIPMIASRNSTTVDERDYELIDL
jgi:hypothetical protein